VDDARASGRFRPTALFVDSSTECSAERNRDIPDEDAEDAEDAQEADAEDAVVPDEHAGEWLGVE
jgi:hypothetical protein